ncbi:MAG TPA: hypothetical protein V6D06_11595 [Trichocoleus sp.]
MNDFENLAAIFADPDVNYALNGLRSAVIAAAERQGFSAVLAASAYDSGYPQLGLKDINSTIQEEFTDRLGDVLERQERLQEQARQAKKLDEVNNGG